MTFNGGNMSTSRPTPNSAFASGGMRAVVDDIIEEIQDLYLEDSVPWVVGYSGGKDSTAVLQLVWMALSDLNPDQRKKPVHVISTDTLVENPIVASWVSKSLLTMKQAAEEQGLPIEPHRLTPDVKDTFWVNLIGRGYPAPRVKFRWCTERLKIKPSNKFILGMVQANGEAILVLGTRKAESVARARTMTRLESKRVRDRLSPNSALPSSLVYSPIEDWNNDDVWVFLMQHKNPWGYRNKDLLTMYQGASQDGECPLVIDTTTPSCGDSRFGCWVCTLVEKDRSMAAMIQNDEEKEWMLPLLELRNELDIADDRHLRDFRRMTGYVQLYNDRAIHGPYTQEARERWLVRLLAAQRHIRENGPAHVRDIELISKAELEEIRRIWVYDKHEIEDKLPLIYQQQLGEFYFGGRLEDSHVFGLDEIALLRDACEGDDLQFELLRELLDVEGQYRTVARRAGLFDAIEGAFKRSAFVGMEDATARARLKRDALEAAAQGDIQTLDSLLERARNTPDMSALEAPEYPAS